MKVKCLSHRKFISRNDIIIVGVIILVFSFSIAIKLFGESSNDLIAIISYSGEEYERIKLSNVEESFDIVIDKDNNLVVRVEKGRIRYISSDCKDKICVETGWLETHGDFAACVPLRSSITIVGNEGDRDTPDIVLS